MRRIETPTLIVECYDAAVWLQERNLIKVTARDGSGVTSVQLKEGSVSAPVLATYSLDGDGRVEIDATEILRRGSVSVGGSVPTLIIAEQVTSVPAQIDGTVAGLIHPVFGMIPTNRALEPIVPPSVIFEQLGSVPNAVEFFVKNVCEFSMRDEQGEQIGSGVDIPANVTYIGSADGAYTYDILTYDDISATVTCKKMECGRVYAAVRWVSMTGRERVAVWEVVNRKSETGDTVDLLTQDNSYDVVKGRKDMLTLRLEGLNAYDYWYYSDICHSSKVEVSFDGVEWQSVEVRTKGVTIPNSDEGKLSALNVELNYKRYDAFSL